MLAVSTACPYLTPRKWGLKSASMARIRRPRFPPSFHRSRSVWLSAVPISQKNHHINGPHRLPLSFGPTDAGWLDRKFKRSPFRACVAHSASIWLLPPPFTKTTLRRTRHHRSPRPALSLLTSDAAGAAPETDILLRVLNTMAKAPVGRIYLALRPPLLRARCPASSPRLRSPIPLYYTASHMPYASIRPRRPPLIPHRLPTRYPASRPGVQASQRAAFAISLPIDQP
ncbi:hypothetical protein B0H16DRAFT_1837479 [Mycena metata]|uniref:Uncharacterized protein n=1 Tax=Mycena metata TaxID=1033252 RepID=A0AAD7IX83_9AGAR|nr:hypothetical protein B0H16DRAFT_1837479 [Mycena metata]